MTFPYLTFTSPIRLPFSRSLTGLCLGLSLGILGGCASLSSTRGGAGSSGGTSTRSSEATLTAEESADALRLAQESRLELQTQSARLKELEGQVRDLTEILSWNAEQIQNQNLRIDSLRQGIRPGSSANAQASSSYAPTGDSGMPAEAAPARRAPQRISSDEASQYRLALDQYFGRNYAAAQKAFTDLQSKYPTGAYADNAEYWIGECRFALGDFTGALASFRKVFTYSGTEKADDAQLKIGFCYLRLNDRKKAEEEFRKLVSLYPSSEYVDRAQGEIDKLAGKPADSVEVKPRSE